jgi:protease-4
MMFFCLFDNFMIPLMIALELCQVTVVELSRPSPSLPEILRGLGNSLVGVDQTLKELLHDLTFSDGVQARMDGIMFQKLEGYPSANPILTLMKDYLSSM